MQQPDQVTHKLLLPTDLLTDPLMTRLQPDAEFLTVYETRSLRDTRELLKTTSMDDAYAFVDTASHPRLWRILAEHALESLDFTMADKSFVRCADYQGIQFVKHLQKLNDRFKQKAEVAVYFKVRQIHQVSPCTYSQLDRWPCDC